MSSAPACDSGRPLNSNPAPSRAAESKAETEAAKESAAKMKQKSAAENAAAQNAAKQKASKSGQANVQYPIEHGHESPAAGAQHEADLKRQKAAAHSTQPAPEQTGK